MRFVQQKVLLPVQNQDVSVVRENTRHGSLLPNTIRAIICGPSNCGKTNALLSLIFEPNGLRFENIYVFSKSLFQPKYELLQNVISKIKGIGYFTYDQNEQIIDPSEAKENSIIIFDDVACDKQNKIRGFFSMGRHKKIDSFYLCQTYTKIPKHLIRDNVNMLIIFKQDEVNLKHIYDEHVNTDMTYSSFKDVCIECWKNKFGFFVLVKDADIDNGRYRKGFDTFIML